MSLTDKELEGLLEYAADLIEEYRVRTGESIFDIIQKIETMLEGR